MNSWELLVCAVVGGSLPDVLRWFSLRGEITRPEFVTKGVVWSSLIFSIWLGIATVLSAHMVQAWEGFLLGYATPQLVSKILADRNAPAQPLSVYRLGIPAVWRIQRWWAL